MKKPLAGLKILLVEDEYMIAIDSEDMLRDMGAAEVEIANTFEIARDRIDHGQFDLVILDVNLNGQLSFPLAQTLSKRGTPMVYATGYSLMNRPRDGFEGGVCLNKPYTADRLRDSVLKALQGRAPAGEAKAVAELPS